MRAIAGAMLTLFATAAAAQQMEKQPGKMDKAHMEKMMSDWPAVSREAAHMMMQKYGEPAVVTPQALVWGKAGPWKRSIIFREPVQHNFPVPHQDVWEQWIDYMVPAAMFDDIAAYDGSVIAYRTNGELSARCDKEGANFLAINLAHDIVTGKRTPEDARMMYAAQIKAMMAKQPAPYTEKLLFAPPMGGTADPDHPAGAKH